MFPPILPFVVGAGILYGGYRYVCFLKENRERAALDAAKNVATSKEVFDEYKKENPRELPVNPADFGK